MDENVEKAMARWPDVPAAFGWLRLDRRGRWYLVDRNAPEFDEARDGKGSLITSDPIVEFISRNYACDEQGRWYWQNGPQKAYADLDVAPLIMRVLTGSKGQALVTHTGYPVNQVHAAFLTTNDELMVQSDLGPGAIHDLDLSALELTESSVVIAGESFELNRLTEDAASALGFVLQPRN
ncbi:MAG: DUF2946 family protein [Burkholderiaceae bacterium]